MTLIDYDFETLGQSIPSLYGARYSNEEIEKMRNFYHICIILFKMLEHPREGQHISRVSIV